LWPNGAPNAITNSDYKEIEVIKEGQLTSTSKVTIPTLLLFLPDKSTSNGAAVIICPGGGYSHLAIDKEGFKVAKWLNTLGITAFVLKYRLPNDEIMENKTIGPLQDAQEAMRMVRRNAKTWNINPEKIGTMGFSAGGHLASTLSTHYLDEVYVHDTISAKPDFSILIYPVISMEQAITHEGSKTNLLGNAPSERLIKYYSNEQQIDSLTPPVFLVHATDDKAVPVENSIHYYMALKNNNVPAELHIYEKGGHGFGLGISDTNLYWTESCEHWLKSNKYMD
jgi:acetyl esterase/lipase